MHRFMNKTLVTAAFVVLALLLSTHWDLPAIKILLTGCLLGWLARSVVANIKESNRKAKYGEINGSAAWLPITQPGKKAVPV